MSVSGKASELDPALSEWLDDLYTPFDRATEQAHAAPRRLLMPAIMLSRSEAAVLRLIVRLARCERVIEVGTLAGFSAIEIARGLAPDGHLWTIEREPYYAEIARLNLHAAGLSDRVTVMEGSARDMLATLADKAPFDAVFLDGDKQDYGEQAQWATAHLRTGGLLLADNVLLGGDLLAEDALAQSMRGFHEHVAAHYDGVCVHTHEGLLLAIRRDEQEG